MLVQVGLKALSKKKSEKTQNAPDLTKSDYSSDLDTSKSYSDEDTPLEVSDIDSTMQSESLKEILSYLTPRQLAALQVAGRWVVRTHC